MEGIFWFIAVMDLAGICLVLWFRRRMEAGHGLPSIDPDSIPATPKCKLPKKETKPMIMYSALGDHFTTKILIQILKNQKRILSELSSLESAGRCRGGLYWPDDNKGDHENQTQEIINSIDGTNG